MAEFLKTPQQASYTFSLDGTSAPRPKNLFYVSFTRAGGNSSQTSWMSDLSFLIKSVDRPAVTPTVEELNQYGKRRQIHTGYKVAPMKITFYDTADSLALQMWNEYVAEFFGDFGHEENRDDFRYDVTRSAMKNASGTGFGFAPKAMTSSDDNSHFFFDSISVFQVFKNQYVQFDIINPKITSFDPDDLTYDNSNIGTITMTLAYEAIVYKNNGVPQALDGAVAEAFEDSGMNGNVIDLPNDGAEPFETAGTALAFAGEQSFLTADDILLSQQEADDEELRTYSSSVSGGLLSPYGEFDFGSISGSVQDAPINGLTDLASAALLNPAVATALSLTGMVTTNADNASTYLSSPYGKRRYVDANAYDVAKAAIAATGLSGAGYDPTHYGDAVAQGILATSKATGGSPRDQLITHSDPLPPPGTPNTWTSTQAQGITLTPTVYGALNAKRSPYSQIGFNPRGNRGA